MKKRETPPQNGILPEFLGATSCPQPAPSRVEMWLTVPALALLYNRVSYRGNPWPTTTCVIG